MNYSKIYQNIISLARARNKSDVFTERHHILPKSLGGTDDSTNLVFLSTREHYVCHRLLVKIYKNDDSRRKKMIYALWWMSKTHHNLRGFVVTSHQYAHSREKFIEAISDDVERKNKIRKAHDDGKFDYTFMGECLSSTLSNLSKEEMISRMKNSALSCDQAQRANAIRQGKSSEFILERVNGEQITFFSYDDVISLTGYNYDHVKYRLKRHAGYLLNGDKVTCVRKYDGNDKNIGRKRNDRRKRSDSVGTSTVC